MKNLLLAEFSGMPLMSNLGGRARNRNFKKIGFYNGLVA
jgi:hypothetical protein